MTHFQRCIHSNKQQQQNRSFARSDWHSPHSIITLFIDTPTWRTSLASFYQLRWQPRCSCTCFPHLPLSVLRSTLSHRTRLPPALPFQLLLPVLLLHSCLKRFRTSAENSLVLAMEKMNMILASRWSKTQILSFLRLSLAASYWSWSRCWWLESLFLPLQTMEKGFAIQSRRQADARQRSVWEWHFKTATIKRATYEQWSPSQQDSKTQVSEATTGNSQAYSLSFNTLISSTK